MRCIVLRVVQVEMTSSSMFNGERKWLRRYSIVRRDIHCGLLILKHSEQTQLTLHILTRLIRR